MLNKCTRNHSFAGSHPHNFTNSYFPPPAYERENPAGMRSERLGSGKLQLDLSAVMEDSVLKKVRKRMDSYLVCDWPVFTASGELRLVWR